MNARPRNWLFKLALATLSAALAALGVAGWADKARVFDALSAPADSVWAHVALLDPLWPVFAIAMIGCIAAQVLGATATVSFARLAKSSRVWRWLALAFYATSVTFAAYSADMGAQIIFGLPHRAAYEVRLAERSALQARQSAAQAQIARFNSQVLEISVRALEESWPGERAQRQAAPIEEARRGQAQIVAETSASLERLPELPRERAPAPWEGLVFFVFLGWAALEPWGYALADRARVHMPGLRPASRTRAAPVVMARKPTAPLGWLGRAVLAGLGVTAGASATAAETPRFEAPAAPAPVSVSPRVDETHRPVVAAVAETSRKKRGERAAIADADFDRAVKAISARGAKISVRSVAAELTKLTGEQVPATRVHRSQYWREKWAASPT